MNYKIYNAIYQDILENNEDLTVEILTQKYSISEKDLENLLFQIKKNEYVNPNNRTLVNLLEKVSKNKNSLDIYQIISSKENLLNVNSNTPNDINISTQNKDLNEIKSTKNLKSFYLLIFLIVLIVIFIYLINDSKNSSNIQIPNPPKKVEEIKPLPIENKVEKVEENKKELPKEIIQPTAPIVEKNGIKEEIKPVKIPEIKKEVKKEEKIAKSEKIVKEVKEEKVIKNEIKTTSDSIEKIDIYKKDIKFLDNRVFYNGNFYGEGDDLFGFRIFKITPSYVKFEDTKNNVRKRILFNN